MFSISANQFGGIASHFIYCTLYTGYYKIAETSQLPFTIFFIVNKCLLVFKALFDHWTIFFIYIARARAFNSCIFLSPRSHAYQMQQATIEPIMYSQKNRLENADERLSSVCLFKFCGKKKKTNAQNGYSLRHIISFIFIHTWCCSEVFFYFFHVQFQFVLCCVVHRQHLRYSRIQWNSFITHTFLRPQQCAAKNSFNKKQKTKCTRLREALSCCH